MDFQLNPSKIAVGAQKVIDRAEEEARLYGHPVLTDGHLFSAFVKSEWDLFSKIMQSAGLSPNLVGQSIDESLRSQPKSEIKKLQVSPVANLVLNLAFHWASRDGRPAVESTDILVALLDSESFASSILRQYGAKKEVIISSANSLARELEAQDELLDKRLKLSPNLNAFATNLNSLAHKDKLPPVFGRDKEIMQVIEILCHRERPNSVMLLGEAGVGKTAIVEELARRIEFQPESIPLRLRNCQIISMQMNTLVAGTNLRGTFEDRIKDVIRELREKPHLIVFVDEAHTIVGAGAALGAPSDAADVLKPVMARGELRVIGATTRSEYKETIQKDEAFARRFRCINISEPTIEETRHILYNLRPRLERNYFVQIANEAIETVLEMSPRYMRHLHLPDKVIGWLDTACVRSEITSKGTVESADIIKVIADTAQVPLNMVSRNVVAELADMEEKLGRLVVGQQKAITAVAERIALNKGPLKDGFSRPDGVFMFLGPTGVGKTKLAKALAEYLLGDESRVIRIDMSEYQNGAIGIEKLIGMPRGITGSETGGILTNQIMDNPYSVILLDEIEKAAPEALNIFLQAFDEGWITDGRGKKAYLSDAVVIMTSNLGSGHFKRMTNPLGFLKAEVPLEQIKKEIVREFKKRFSPEFRNRIDRTVIFSPLAENEVKIIAEDFITRIKSVLEKLGKVLIIDDDVLDALVSKGYSLAYGARFLKRTVEELVEIPITKNLDRSSCFHVRVNNRGQVEVSLNGVSINPSNAPSSLALN